MFIPLNHHVSWLNEHLPMVFLWFSPFSHGFPMLFPWFSPFSHGFPMVSTQGAVVLDLRRGRRVGPRAARGVARHHGQALCVLRQRQIRQGHRQRGGARGVHRGLRDATRRSTRRTWWTTRGEISGMNMVSSWDLIYGDLIWSNGIDWWVHGTLWWVHGTLWWFNWIEWWFHGISWDFTKKNGDSLGLFMGFFMMTKNDDLKMVKFKGVLSNEHGDFFMDLMEMSWWFLMG